VTTVMRSPLNVERAARKDLRAFPPVYRDSALGRAYLLLARRLDAGLSASDTVRAVNQMRLCLLTLTTLAPPSAGEDFVDEFTTRREQRMRELQAATR
jgi:hypothetical protein